MSIKTGQFIKLSKINYNKITEAFLEHSRTFMVELFCEKGLTAESR